MRHVVVGYDGSDPALEALKWGASEARMHGASLVVVTVLDEEHPEHDHDPALATGTRVEDIVAGLADGLKHDVVRERGHAAERLLASCTPEDLLVLGSRGRRSLTSIVRGSVGRSCAHAAPCPVAIVRGDLARVGPVVVGVDGSESAQRALLVGAEEARLRGVALQAVHGVFWDPTGVEMLTPGADELEAWGRHLLVGEIKKSGVQADPVVETGHPSEALVRASEQASLLVVGSRGRSPVAGLLLGSTSADCAIHAACPTLIVR